MTVKALGSIVIGLLLFGAEAAEAVPAAVNLAANAQVTLVTGGADPVNDTKKLTDGRFAPGLPLGATPETTLSYFGWSPFLFEVDLGGVQPIGGMALYSQVDQNTPLDAVFVCGSADGKSWYPVAEMRGRDNPQAPDYPRWIYKDMTLNSQARYLKVALIARSLPLTYYFDEFEVYRGDAAKVAAVPEGTADYKALLDDALTRAGSRKRLDTDLTALRQAAGDKYAAETQALEQRIADFDAPGAKGFSSVFPQNEIQRDIYRLFARHLREQNPAALYAWSPYRYHFATPFDLPGVPLEKLDFKVLGNEARSEIVTLLNTAADDRTITVELAGAPEALAQLEIYRLPWTDTAEGISVSTIMIPVEVANNRFTLELPSGLSVRLALTFDGGKLAPGQYPLTLNIDGHAYAVTAEVSPVKLPEEQQLLVGTWDYTDNLPAMGMTEKNVDSAVRLMDKMRINVPWGGGLIYFPLESDFNAAGEFTGDLKMEKFEQWLKQRPGKPMYCVFINTEALERNNIGPWKFGTPEFELRAANWIRAWDQHLRQMGLQPGQVQWLLVDEVWDDHKRDIQTAWSKAFRTAAPAVLRNWNNPVVDVREERFAEMIELVDTLCSGRDRQYEEEYRPFYLAHQAAGKPWWTYSCNGPSRLFDPFSYYKLHGLGSWLDRIQGIGIWSFADNGGVPAWNEYLLSWAIFAPTAVDETEVLSTLALEAFREGIEDFELFTMLEQALPEMPEAERQQAEKLLADLRQYLFANTNIHIKWFNAEAELDRRQADEFRSQAIVILEKQAGK